MSNNFKLGIRSLQNLSGVHPDLVAVVKRAIQITEVDFTVIEGIRSRERQKQLVSKGASKTMNSRHITGHAVDMVPWPIDWDDLERFEIMAESKRKSAYTKEPDPLFFQWQPGEATQEEWLAKREEIRARFPYPA